MVMTRKQNLHMVLDKKVPQWVPFSPNFQQWYDHHKNFNLLPAELQGVSDYMGAMKVLGCDIFTRNVASGLNISDSKIDIWEHSIVRTSNGLQTISVVKTPHGKLTQINETQEALSTGYCKEHLVKNWQQEKDAFLWFLDQQAIRWNGEEFYLNSAKIGDEGILLARLGPTPLKLLHGYFGLDGTCFFVMDHYEDAKALCDLYWSKLLPIIKSIASDPETQVMIFMDNLDTPFYPPSICKDFWSPYVKEAADVIHKKNKSLFVHACGKLVGLSGEIAESEVDGLEGISAPPLGDWPYEQAKKCHPKFIVNGGFSAREQEMSDEGDLCEYYEGVFKSMQPLDRWIFAASCQTSINTTWERLKLVRDIVRELGQISRSVSSSKAVCL